MEYKVGIDRVHINDEEENFPYPLKLWSDGQNIYVKVLRLPSSIDEFPRKDEVMQNEGDFDSTRFKLCIETLLTSKIHGGKYYEQQDAYRQKKFQVIARSINNFIVDNIYTFSIFDCMTSTQRCLTQFFPDVYLTVRATLRYPDSNSLHLHGRTGIYSNTAKIIYKK